MNKEEQPKISKKSLLITIFSLLAVIITGTFAWLTWRSNNTAMVLRIGDVSGLTVTLKPYKINATLSPVASYTSNENVVVVDVTAENRSTQFYTFNLFYQIDTIDSALIDEGFKYTITKCTANCDTASNYSLLNDDSGDFSTASSNSNFNIYETIVPGGATYKYRVYLWIDSSAGNQANMQNKNFIGELRASMQQSTTQTIVLNDFISQDAVMDNIASSNVTNSTGINFNAISSDTNGKGIYIRSGTENDTYPIYYYRGAVNNNNVLFGGFCWKIVRTTSTGGTKLVYNGAQHDLFTSTPLPDSNFIITNDSTYPFTYDSTNMTWTSTMQDDRESAEIVFAIKTAGDYVINYTVSSEANFDKAYFFKNDVQQKFDSGAKMGTVVLNGLTSFDTIKVKYEKDSSSATGNDNIVFTIDSKGTVTGTNCNNSDVDSQLPTTSGFNGKYNSLADVGYMYGTRYEISDTNGTGWYYAPDVTYANGTYTLTSKGSYNVETKSTISGTNLNYHHYTCGSTTETSCASARYVYRVSYTTAYYITLTNGKKVEDALNEMLTDSANTNNSTIKTVIDNWYESNMTSYTDKLEDTPYCNDRTIYQYSGWDPNGGDTTKDIYFGAYGRTKSPYTPSLTCNTNDAFTLPGNEQGNGKLIYPVGLLTADEVRLSGGSNSNNSTYYLYTNQTWWLASPYYFQQNVGSVFDVYSTGTLDREFTYKGYGGRPAVSLKAGTMFSSGDGTVNNPYIVE